MLNRSLKKQLSIQFSLNPREVCVPTPFWKHVLNSECLKIFHITEKFNQIHHRRLPPLLKLMSELLLSSVRVRVETCILPCFQDNISSSRTPWPLQYQIRKASNEKTGGPSFDGLGWLCRQYTQGTTEAVLLEANQRRSDFQTHYLTDGNLAANPGGAGTLLWRSLAASLMLLFSSFFSNSIWSFAHPFVFLLGDSEGFGEGDYSSEAGTGHAWQLGKE